jgi:hypothetical protein
VNERTDWTYHAVFRPPFSSSEVPDTVLRKLPGTPRDQAERLGQDGTWEPSDLVALVYLGHNDTDLLEITRERASELAHGWYERRSIPRIPTDLA